MNTVAALGAVAIVIVAAIALLAVTRTGDQNAAARPSGSAASTASASGAPTGIPSASATAVLSPASTSAAPAAGVKPDAAHGLITFENIRSEIDPKNLQEPAEFSRTGFGSFTVGVSPDGKRVAMIRGGQTGQQLVFFATARPKDVTAVLDWAGTGEYASGVVWSGDGADSILIAVHKISAPGAIDPPATYSTLRVVQLASKQMTEIARITNGNYLMPLAMPRGGTLAGAAEIGSGGRVGSYVLVRNGVMEKTALTNVFATAITASRDGQRIVAVTAPSLRWWPVDQPAAAKQLEADVSRGRAVFAAFRPGADELGVSVVAATVGGPAPPGHFEIWTLSGPQRVVSPTAGFSFWRVDGSAAIDGSLLIDPASGATTQFPGGAFKIADVVMF
jgi:hypothetical protein